MSNKPQYDGLIFDLDGTLWNATDTYAFAWNETLNEFGYDITVYPSQLVPIMGMQEDLALETLLPSVAMIERKRIYSALAGKIIEAVAVHGAKIYPGVSEGIQLLKNHFRLFILSNCPTGLIPAFLKCSGLEGAFESVMCYGDSPQSKSENLRKMVLDFSLKRPVYIGDTEKDWREASKAGVAFLFASYGFGQPLESGLSFESFNSFVNYFLPGLPSR